MKASATVPTRFVNGASSKGSPPGPSTPASIPIPKKRMSAGMRVLSETVPASRLRKNSRPVTR